MAEFSSVQETISTAQWAEANGFQSFWIAEDYFPVRGAISVASGLAARTQSIRIGTGVINPYTRHPVLIAMEIQALDELSHGRAFLGLGASEKYWMEDQLHIEYGSAQRHLRECIEIVRGVLKGDEFSYTGKCFSVSGVKLFHRPWRARVPIYLGVVRQHNLALAGELSDGLCLPLMSNPPYVRYAMDHARRGGQKAGRDLKDFSVYMCTIVSVDEDRTVARARVKPMLGEFLGYLKDHPVFTCTGHAEGELKPFVQAQEQGKDATDLVPDWAIDTFAVAGQPKECVEKLEALAEAGVTGFLVFDLPGTPLKDTVSAVAKSILAAFK